MANKVYIATSVDGFIADRDNRLDWLDMIPNPDQSDLGFNDFINGIDAIVMGRNTFDAVMSFGIDWPYIKPVFVWSRSLKGVPSGLEDKVHLIQGTPSQIDEELHRKGYKNLYIDGGLTIQSFLRDDLIDELTLTKLPVLLGGGVPLFDTLPKAFELKLESVNVLLEQLVSIRYVRK